MGKLIIIESTDTGFQHECHKVGCRDVAKKLSRFDHSWVVDTIAEAKADYECENENYEAENGEGAGWYWDEHVKVYPCTAD